MPAVHPYPYVYAPASPRRCAKHREMRHIDDVPDYPPPSFLEAMASTHTLVPRASTHNLLMGTPTREDDEDEDLEIIDAASVPIQYDPPRSRWRRSKQKRASTAPPPASRSRLNLSLSLPSSSPSPSPSASTPTSPTSHRSLLHLLTGPNRSTASLTSRLGLFGSRRSKMEDVQGPLAQEQEDWQVLSSESPTSTSEWSPVSSPTATVTPVPVPTTTTPVPVPTPPPPPPIPRHHYPGRPLPLPPVTL